MFALNLYLIHVYIDAVEENTRKWANEQTKERSIVFRIFRKGHPILPTLLNLKRHGFIIIMSVHWTWLFAQSIVSSVSVCLSVFLFVCFSVRLRVTKTTLPHFNKFSVLVTCGRDLVLLWRQCNALCTSGFVDDVVLCCHTMDGISPNQRRRVCFV